MSGPIRVLLIDDHPAILAGLRVILGQAPDVEIVGEATTLAEAEALLENTQSDVVVLDYKLGEDSGIGLLDALAEAESRPVILLLSAHDNPAYLHEAHRLGAAGYFLKALALDVVLEGVRQAERGQTVWTLDQLARIRAWKEQVKFRWDALTDRERDVLRALAQGKSNREISAELHITERTVEHHVGKILGKLGVGSRSEVVVWMRDADLERFTL